MKNTTFLWIGICVCLSLILYILCGYTNDKIAYVESTRLFQEYNGAKKERERLEAKSNEFKLRIDTLNREVQESIIQFDGQDNTSSKSVVLLKQKQLEEYRKNVQLTLQEEEAQAMTKIAEELNSFLKAYGKRHRYKFILIANPSGTIAYAQEGTNITDDVINELNGGI